MRQNLSEPQAGERQDIIYTMFQMGATHGARGGEGLFLTSVKIAIAQDFDFLRKSYRTKVLTISIREIKIFL